jgi:hypothetical protein
VWYSVKENAGATIPNRVLQAFHQFTIGGHRAARDDDCSAEFVLGKQAGQITHAFSAEKHLGNRKISECP